MRAKVAEKEAARAAESTNDDLYDEDAVLDPRAKALREKQMELESDMKNAAELFGTDSSGMPHFVVYPHENNIDSILHAVLYLFVKILLLDDVGAQVDITAILNANPKTKEEFVILSRQIFELVIKRHQDKPLYASFVEAHTKELASPLRDVEVRKVASGLTALASEKQKELKDKAGGKKKKGVVKPALGSVKALGKCVSDPGAQSKFWMFTTVIVGLIQTHTRKLWTTSAPIQMTSCELVNSPSHPSQTLHRGITRVLIVPVPLSVLSLHLPAYITINF